jgi:hypothetical protein
MQLVQRVVFYIKIDNRDIKTALPNFEKLKSEVPKVVIVFET